MEIIPQIKCNKIDKKFITTKKNLQCDPMQFAMHSANSNNGCMHTLMLYCNDGVKKQKITTSTARQ